MTKPHDRLTKEEEQELNHLMDKYKKAKSFFENGVKCYLSKNFEEAEKNFLKALEIAPTSLPVLENLSKVYLAQEKYNEAEKKLNYLISLDKENDSIGYYLLLDLYIKKNNYFDLVISINTLHNLNLNNLNQVMI